MRASKEGMRLVNRELRPHLLGGKKLIKDKDMQPIVNDASLLDGTVGKATCGPAEITQGRDAAPRGVQQRSLFAHMTRLAQRSLGLVMTDPLLDDTVGHSLWPCSATAPTLAEAQPCPFCVWLVYGAWGVWARAWLTHGQKRVQPAP